MLSLNILCTNNKNMNIIQLKKEAVFLPNDLIDSGNCIIRKVQYALTN